jgi:hypothetical protein
LERWGGTVDGDDDIQYVVEKSKVADYMENKCHAPAAFDLGTSGDYDDAVAFTVYGLSTNGKVGREIVYGDQSLSDELPAITLLPDAL